MQTVISASGHSADHQSTGAMIKFNDAAADDDGGDRSNTMISLPCRTGSNGHYPDECRRTVDGNINAE